MSSKQINTNERKPQMDSEQEQTDDASAESHPDDCELSKDEIFHILQNERRRNVLQYIADTDEPVRMRDVAEQVAAWEHETTVQELTSDQRQRVYIPLYQSHLPKLDKVGLIEYQQNRGIVERKPLADQVDRYLQAKPESQSVTSSDQELEWDDYYIGVAAISAVMLLGAVFELPFFSIISGIGLGAVILLLFSVLTVGRYVR